MADSLDSGSSAHSGRAGSSPASRTKKKTATERLRFFFLVCGGYDLNPIKTGSKQAHAVGLFGKRKNLCDRDGGHTSCVHQLPSQRFFRRPASRTHRPPYSEQRLRFFFLVYGGSDLNPIKNGSPTQSVQTKWGKAKSKFVALFCSATSAPLVRGAVERMRA